ncbi:hypothetical protein KR038_005320, partial [Drosophila bunnanda]
MLYQLSKATTRIRLKRQKAVPQHCWLWSLALLAAFTLKDVRCADLAISIPNNPGLDDGASYRLDYRPPFGYPEPNTTIASRDIGDEIQFSRALPGTKYNFWLYYTNFTHHDWLTWTVTITT